MGEKLFRDDSGRRMSLFHTLVKSILFCKGMGIQRMGWSGKSEKDVYKKGSRVRAKHT